MVRFLIAVVAITITLWFLSGYVTDPLGFTTRESIRAATTIATTQLETSAAVGIAETESSAKIRIAEVEADAEKSKASERRKIHQTWARTLPILFIIVAAAGAFWFVVTYWGRALLLLLQHIIDRDLITVLLFHGRRLDKPEVDTAIDESVEDVLDEYAAQRNQYVIRQNGYHLLVDNATDEVVSQLTRK